MVLLGFRERTEDIDYTAEVDRDEDFIQTVRALMRELDISAEPAGPGDFIPLPMGWRERSGFHGRFGGLDVFTFDPVSTALSKIARGSQRDLDDSLRLVRERIVSVEALATGFEDVIGRLATESVRVDEADFRLKFTSFLAILASTQS